jgi:AcrR family transcriptional regulator
MSSAPDAPRGSSRLSRERIAQTALALADRDGLDAVSMRRIAAELGVGTMSLYHYVRDKDDLYGLVGDRIMGELLVPEDEFDASDWRAAIRAIARRSRDVFARHAWIWGAMHEGGRLGVNVLRHFEQSLAAVQHTGLDGPGRLELIAIVDDFVFGHSYRTVLEPRMAGDEDWQTAMRNTVDRLLGTGEYPQMEGLLGEGDRAQAWAQLEAHADPAARFEHGLEALLDGLERRLGR